MIWTSCILCLAHLAALCHFMGRRDSALSTSMNSLYELTLDSLCNLSREPHFEACSSFDVLTGVRISQGSVPPDEAKRLPELIHVLMIRCPGSSCWELSKGVSNYNWTRRADRWDIGRRSSKRRMPIFKQTSRGSNLTRLLAWLCRRMVVRRTRSFRT